MSTINSFNVTYDRDGDVLYISKRKAPASRGIEDQFGIVWRYDGDGELIGATIVDFHGRWYKDKDALTVQLSRQFQITPTVARVVLDYAFKE